jgi:hypothetical protein
MINSASGRDFLLISCQTNAQWIFQAPRYGRMLVCATHILALSAQRRCMGNRKPPTPTRQHQPPRPCLFKPPPHPQIPPQLGNPAVSRNPHGQADNSMCRPASHPAYFSSHLTGGGRDQPSRMLSNEYALQCLARVRITGVQRRCLREW